VPDSASARAERLDANNNFTALIHGHAFAPVASLDTLAAQA